MKKIVFLLLTISSSFFLFACKNKVEDYQFSSTMYYMDTYISVGGTSKDEAHAEYILNEIDLIFDRFHQLAHNFQGLSEDSPYLENAYTLNRKIGQRVEIDSDLYDLIKTAEDYKILTNGFFDISIGKMVDAWKHFVQSDEEDMESLYQQTITLVDQIDTSDFDIILEHADNRFYVTLKGKDMKIDLGALAKGYAAQKAADFIINEGIEYYFISAGTSSIILGEKADSEENNFRIGLAHPVDLSFPRTIYGRLFAKNTSVTTSANYEQFMLYNNNRYHHIVSPITRRPMQYYHALTLIGPDAGFLDAVGTALFCMDEQAMLSWLELYQTQYELEMVYFRENGTIGVRLVNTIFEEKTA
jgi:thiamine biosynthesis lipoprotein